MCTQVKRSGINGEVVSKRCVSYSWLEKRGVGLSMELGTSLPCCSQYLLSLWLECEADGSSAVVKSPRATTVFTLDYREWQLRRQMDGIAKSMQTFKDLMSSPESKTHT